jgi:hypothetical protein
MMKPVLLSWIGMLAAAATMPAAAQDRKEAVRSNANATVPAQSVSDHAIPIGCRPSPKAATCDIARESEQPGFLPLRDDAKVDRPVIRLRL